MTPDTARPMTPGTARRAPTGSTGSVSAPSALRFLHTRSTMPRLYASALLLLTFSVAAPAALAQTGKVQGTVTEAPSGDPLPGVNVRLENSTFGAVTDVDGQYVIVGVRPGTYAVVFTYLGYRTERRENVRVNIDLTTTIDVRLREGEDVAGEEIVVEATPPAVRRDVTSSEARVTSETLDRLPVQELSQVIGVQAGITERGGLHIRGGRSSEVLYMVDGVPVTDAYDGSQAVQVENDGIEELQVISGTFNAEYGNAMSGIINVVTKEGRNDRWGGSVEAYSGTYLVGDRSGGRDLLLGINPDRYTTAGVQYRDVDPYGYLPVEPNQYYNAAIGLEGPLVRNRATLYVLGRFFNNDGWLYGANIFNPDATLGDSSIVALNNYRKFSYQGNLKLTLSNRMIVNLIALGSTAEGRSGDFSRRYSPEGRSRFFDDGLDTKVKFTHLLSNRTFYTLDVARFNRRAQNYLYEDPTDPRYNDLGSVPPPFIVVRGDTLRQDQFTGGGRFLRYGTDLGRGDRTTNTFIAKADLTSQLHPVHLVKTGFQAKLETLDFEGYALRDVDAGTPGFQAGAPDATSLDYNAFDNVRPFTFSAYLQDKIEMESFIVNAGVRFDYFDARGRVPADPTDPNIFNPFKKVNIYNDLNGDGVIDASEEVPANEKTVAQRAESWYRDTEAKYAISPRLGVAYPITDQGVIHFSYGYFLQIPTLNRLFDNYDYKIRPETGSYGPFGNPDLENERTVMYELGLKQGFGDYVVDVTGYYRDVRNWVAPSPPINTELPGVTYTIWANRDYANTKGVTLAFSKGFTRGYGWNLAYTFQVVEGGLSDQTQQFYYGNQAELVLLPLGWDQRHKVAGAVYAGGRRWGMSGLFNFGTGFPYTPSFPRAAQQGPDVQRPNAVNSRRIPSTFQLDMNAYREFSLAGVRPRLFVQVYNILDLRNVQGVYSDTGRPDYTTQTPGAYDPGFYVNPGFYSEPRRIHVGVEFKF
jgi:outer membrane receptor protein involved in Fe transport